MAEIVDLRGRRLAPAPAAVLADPSGRRMRVLAIGGRAVAVVFLLWLVGLVLAGLGLLPAGDVPLGRALGGQAPPSLRALPRPRQPSASDLAPAKPLRLTADTRSAARGAGPGRRGASGGQRSGLTATGVARHPGSGSAQRGGSASPTGSAPAVTGTQNPTGASAPGRTTAPGQTRKQSTPGHTKTSAPGHSGSAPGHVRPTTTTTSPGKSGSAPGHTVTHGSGHGNGG